MRVDFGDLEEMLKELKEKGINEVRVEAQYERRHEPINSGPLMKGGVTPDVHRYCVTVEALLFTSEEMKAGAPVLYGHFERITESATTWSVEARDLDWETIAATNLEHEKEIRDRLERRGFRVMSGHFVEV